MKKSINIRNILSILLLFCFAITNTACKKEQNITPQAPSTPVTPVSPAVSTKPIIITTSENGTTMRKQIYEYNEQGKLIKYQSRDRNNGLDSVLIRSNNIAFKASESNSIAQSLTLNNDKSFKSIFNANDQTDFVNNSNKLVRMLRIRTNNTPINVGEFTYTEGNLSSIQAEIRIDINYHQNLPYQKGINEIPVALKPIKFYKIMEMENATSTVLYNKLIRQIILDFGSRRELHEYSYTFDSNNRVTQINDTQTTIVNNVSAQKTIISTITYNN